MKRIYLDSNVFRNLKQQPNLLEETFDVINNLNFYYSYAHLADLTRDTTEQKYDDLVFMENLVDRNFLYLHPGQKHVNIQLISPSEAFKNLINVNFQDINIESIIDNLYPHENIPVEIQAAKEALKAFLDFPLHALRLQDQDPALKGTPIESLTPNGTNSIKEYIAKLLNTFNDLQTDDSLWRGLRSQSIDNSNFKKFNIDIQNIDFNEKLQDTSLQKSFIEFVETALSKFPNAENTAQYNFFTTAYTCLNLLGIDNEKNKKVVFSSFQNDAQHAYYAAHCEYLVSDDAQLLHKAKALYNLLGIKTKVFSLQDFFENLKHVACNGELDNEEFIEKLNNLSSNIDYSNSEILNGVSIFRLKENYFDYFNELQIIEGEGEQPIFAFYKEYKNYSMFESYEEKEIITNRIVRTLGRDLYNIKYYSAKDTTEIQEGNWQGRIWDFEFSTFYLEINNERLVLHYQPKVYTN